MKSRSSTLLTVLAFGVALAALAPRLLKSLAGFGGRPPSAPAAPSSAMPARSEPPVAPVVEEPAAVPEPAAAVAPVVPEPAMPAAFPWLQPAGQPAPTAAPEAVAPASWQPQSQVPPSAPFAPVPAPAAWTPAPPSGPSMPAAQGYAPYPQPWAPPPQSPYGAPAPGTAPFSRGWAPPGTYQPPPMPPGGYRPNGGGYAPPVAPPPSPPVEAREPRPAVVAPAPPPPAAVEPEIVPLTDEELEETIVPRRSGARRWFSTITSIIGILLLISVVATLVFVAVAPRALGWEFVVVSGGSMEPTIHLGAVAVMDSKVQPKDLKIGDIVMFSDPTQPGRAVTHRIIDIKDNGGTFVTRGDANKAADAATVPGQFIRGRYLFSIPAAGRFVHWMGTSQGYLVIILVPGVVIIAWELRSLSRNRNKPSGTSRS